MKILCILVVVVSLSHFFGAAEARAYDSDCAEVYRQRAEGDADGFIKRIGRGLEGNAHVGGVLSAMGWVGLASPAVGAFVELDEVIGHYSQNATESLNSMSRVLYQASTEEKLDAWQDFYRRVHGDFPKISKVDLEKMLQDIVSQLDSPTQNQLCRIKKDESGKPILKKGKVVISVVGYDKFVSIVERKIQEQSQETPKLDDVIQHITDVNTRPELSPPTKNCP